MSGKLSDLFGSMDAVTEESGRDSPMPPSSAASPMPEKENEKQVLSYFEITEELAALTKAANAGETFDEDRLDELLQLRSECPEYKLEQKREMIKWQVTNQEFLSECLDITRSFVPPTVFSDNLNTLTEYGLSLDISKRILQKQCLWLVRLDASAISRLHESDLYHRYNPSLLDLVELAAVYAVLPDSFTNDHLNKKMEWKDSLVDTLKRYMADRDRNSLPKGKLRAACYDNYFAGKASSASPVPGVIIPDGVLSPVNSPTPAAGPSSGSKSAAVPSVFKAAAGAAAPSSSGAGSHPAQNTEVTAKNIVPFNGAEGADPGITGKMGPITDLTTLHQTEVMKSAAGYAPRRSFTEVCKTHGILSKLKRKNSV